MAKNIKGKKERWKSIARSHYIGLFRLVRNNERVYFFKREGFIYFLGNGNIGEFGIEKADGSWNTDYEFYLRLPNASTMIFNEPKDRPTQTYIQNQRLKQAINSLIKSRKSLDKVAPRRKVKA